MNNTKIFLAAFIVVALAQLYVPAKMIWDREDVMESGTVFKFRTAPVDPTDPFRGKYIVLRYEDNRIEVENGDDLMRGEEVFAQLKTDSSGFAKIQAISKDEPNESEHFIKAKVNYVGGSSPAELNIDFPFDRYYMEESKAYEAELTYQESQGDTSTVTYAVVSVKHGEAVLRDVMIDGVSIREIVKENM
jgi:uncharacterized membrane-anchored protein